MATKKSYTRAITIGVIAAVACFVLPFLIGGIVKDNDWKNIGVGSDSIEYIMIYPSWVKSIGLGFGFGTFLVALIGSLLFGYAIGFGSQDVLWLPGDHSDIRKDPTGWIIALAIFGVVLTWGSHWAGAGKAHTNYTYTIPKKEFSERDARHGKYDKHFKKGQTDETLTRVFPIR